MGLLEWLDRDPGKCYFGLIFVALLFFVSAFAVERARFPNDSRYFYPFAVVFTFVALSGLAAVHKPYQERLERTFPWTPGQIECLFILNAAVYLALQAACERFSPAQMRAVAKALRLS